MLNKISAISLSLFISIGLSQSLNAQARQNDEEIMCKVTILEEGKEKVLMVPRSEVVDYHDDSNLVGINCRNEVERT